MDLDLGVLGVLLLVLPLIFLPSISCFGGIWERRTWALRVPLPLHLVHRLQVDAWKLQVEKLITLGCLVPLSLFLLGAWAP